MRDIGERLVVHRLDDDDRVGGMRVDEVFDLLHLKARFVLRK